MNIRNFSVEFICGTAVFMINDDNKYS
jgi:hypothetical protein